MSVPGSGSGAGRHDLLRLSTAGWSTLLARRPDLAAVPGIRLWAEQGHPVMVRRRQPGDAPGLMPAAVALPLAHGRARFGLQVAADEVVSLQPPPSLREVLAGIVPGGTIPDGWRQIAASILAEADRFTVVPRVFGSLMWQCVTGLAYLRERSDLDLIWPIARDSTRAAGLPLLLASLERLDAGPGPRIDGEVMLAGVGAVQWRELAARGTDELLVKTPEGVRLMPRTQFLSLAATPC